MLKLKSLISEEEKRWYFGGNPNIISKAPLFLTTDFEGAKWYSKERGGADGKVSQVIVNPIKSAKYGDLMNIIKKLNLSPDAIVEFSPYDGMNDWDYTYVPVVQEELMRRGFDSIIGSDALENTEIPILIVINPKIIKRIV